MVTALDLFAPPSAQDTVENSFFEELRVVCPMQHNAPIMFHIQPLGGSYLDLGNTCKVVKYCIVNIADQVGFAAGTATARAAFTLHHTHITPFTH